MGESSSLARCSVEDFLDHEGIEYRGPMSGSRGPQFNIKECPACGGDGWKVYLSAETGFGNCFHGSCGKTFNLWTFAKAHLDTTDNRAVHELFDRIVGAGGWKPKVSKRAPAPALPNGLKLPTSYAIPRPDGSNHPYLAQRGIDTVLAAEFELRICEDGAFHYDDENGQPRIQVFSQRVLFPVHDLDGELRTFQGRDITGESDRKYLFPKRLPGTSRFVYHGDKILGCKRLVLGEGPIDTIAIHRALNDSLDFADYGAGGSFGKKLTLDSSPGNLTQLNALFRLRDAGMEEIIFCWDGEAEALASALVASRQLKRYGFSTRIAFLPRFKDPAEIHISTLQKAIVRAVPYSRGLEARCRLRNPYCDSQFESV